MLRYKTLFFLCFGLFSFPVESELAQPDPVNLPNLRAAMSGNWFNPDQSGHGVQIEILDNARAVIAWYTYDGAGEPLWLFGVGTVRVDGIEAELSVFRGGRPPLDWAQAEPGSEPWGSVQLSFSGCDQGLLAWDSTDPDFGSGELEIQRLTRLQGQRCFAEELYSLQLSYSFERRMQGFEAVFADLPENWDQPTYQLDYRREELPAPLEGYQGLRLTGHNSSDDLAMLVKAPVRGLRPDSVYWVELDADIGTNVPTGCAGVGGSPGESVYVKLGAAGFEPLAATDPDDGWLRLNIDFGNQSEEGADARVAGNLSNSQDCAHGPQGAWELKSLTTRGQTLLATTDAAGTLWVFAGTDSAFEGLTRYYITALRVRLEPYEPESASE
jgi:hypothetical protein